MAKRFGDFLGNMDEVLNNAKISNFEEVFSRTKTFTEDLSKKSAERIEISRKKVECLDIKAKLARSYEKFGKLQYSASIGEDVDPADAEACAAEIAALRDRLALLTAEVDAAKKPQDKQDQDI